MLRLAAALAATIYVASTGAAAGEAIKLGWAEKATLYPGGIQMIAKLDSGAWTTSVHADDVEFFKKNGKRWVRFKIQGTNKALVLERRIVKMARIRRAGASVQSRPVVELGICIGTHYRLARVNLNTRDRMRYKLLIGRRYLRKGILLDSSRKMSVEPNCPNAPTAASD